MANLYVQAIAAADTNRRLAEVLTKASFIYAQSDGFTQVKDIYRLFCGSPKEAGDVLQNNLPEFGTRCFPNTNVFTVFYVLSQHSSTHEGKAFYTYISNLASGL